jgi:uncharacterized protein (TIGR00251 family)
MSTLNVKVIPGSRRTAVGGKYGDGIKLYVSAPPEDGRANAAVIALLAETFGVGRGAVRIVRRHGGPRKVVEVDGLSEPQLAGKLAGFA